MLITSAFFFASACADVQAGPCPPPTVNVNGVCQLLGLGTGGTGGAPNTGGTGGRGHGGGASQCDDGTLADLDSEVCLACTTCGLDGPCVGTVDACVNSPDCDAFVTCASFCYSTTIDPVPCVITCQQTYPVGASLFDDFERCQFCIACPNNCSGALDCGS